MKKLQFIFLLSLVSVVVNAQIFTHKQILDKFDDVVFQRDIKTIVEKNDTTFIIEEKGASPITYLIENPIESNFLGSEDNIVNLVGNVYGYQECWCVIMKNDVENYAAAYLAAFAEFDETKRNALISKMVEEYCYYIVHRVVISQYTHELLSELYWIQKGDNDGRTIYSKQY